MLDDCGSNCDPDPCSDVSNGDVNADGSINVIDIVNMVNFAIQIESPTDYEYEAADINNDGEIDILDIVNVINNDRSSL